MIRAETNGYGRVSLLDGSLILSEWYEMSEERAVVIVDRINGTSRAAEINREAVAVCEQIVALDDSCEHWTRDILDVGLPPIIEAARAALAMIRG